MTIGCVLAVLLKGSVSFAGFLVYVSFFEWSLHRYLMHSLVWNYPFQTHALTHHGLFRADYTYHLRCKDDRKKVTFAWWNAPGLFLLHLPLLLAVGHLFGWPAFWGGTVALVLYYALYEYLHWCMHVPRNRWIEKTQVFQWLNAHHHLHHRYAFKNLNVVLPLADWVMGSLVLAPRKNPEVKQQEAT